MQRLDLDIIGTHLRLTMDTEISCDELFMTIRERLEKFEGKYSRFIPGNWLDDLNVNRTAILDADGYAMLTYALEIAKNTDGYFDPTIAGQLSTLGYGRVEHQGHSTGYEKVYIEGDAVSLSGDVILEFGGVGKGYLIDVIKSIITNYELRITNNGKFRFLIDFGGDLYGHGGWKVGLENPHALDEVIGTIMLDDHYLACSSGTKRKWGSHHHLIDPKSGESAREVLATYIEGNSGISSDSYATALSVMPYVLACETLGNTEHLEGVILASDGRVYQSEESRSELFG